MRFLDRLNTPLAFVIVLVIFLAINGFLLYHYQANLRANDTTPSAPAEQRDLTTESKAHETTTSEVTTADYSDRLEEPTLQRALEDCEGEERECVLRFVSETAPQAHYVDGRSLLDESGRERNVLYFSDPSREMCDFERYEGAASETASPAPLYAVIIAGEETFDGQYAEGEVGCLPEF